MRSTCHCLLVEGWRIASCNRVKTGLSMGRRTETSSREPLIKEASTGKKRTANEEKSIPLTFLMLPEMRFRAIQVYFANTRSAYLITLRQPRSTKKAERNLGSPFHEVLDRS